MACACGKNDHSSFLQVPKGPATDKRLCHVLHLDGRENPRFHPSIFQGVLQGERVDDGGQHPHVVGGVAVHLSLIRGGGAPPDVSSTDHNPKLKSRGEDPFDLMGETQDDRMGEMVGRVSQRFAGEFQEESPCFWGVQRSIGVVPVGLPFTRTAGNGCGTGGWSWEFFGGTAGRHSQLWLEKGTKRKKKVQSRGCTPLRTDIGEKRPFP